MHIKRAVVIGLVARVDRYTVPSAAKPFALQRSMAHLIGVSNFPTHCIKRWALSWRGGLDWIHSALSIY